MRHVLLSRAFEYFGDPAIVRRIYSYFWWLALYGMLRLVGFIDRVMCSVESPTSEHIYIRDQGNFVAQGAGTPTKIVTDGQLHV